MKKIVEYLKIYYIQKTIKKKISIIIFYKILIKIDNLILHF